MNYKSGNRSYSMLWRFQQLCQQALVIVARSVGQHAVRRISQSKRDSRNRTQVPTKAQPTPLHHFLSNLRGNDCRRHLQLRRHITQNVDCIETKFPSLSPDENLGKGSFPATQHLHGRIDQMICQACKQCLLFNPQLFRGHEMPLCPESIPIVA